jgi:hypothetical protein
MDVLHNKEKIARVVVNDDNSISTEIFHKNPTKAMTAKIEKAIASQVKVANGDNESEDDAE